MTDLVAGRVVGRSCVQGRERGTPWNAPPCGSNPPVGLPSGGGLTTGAKVSAEYPNKAARLAGSRLGVKHPSPPPGAAAG